jgi:Family of unknown function (DUF5681)
VVRKAPKSACSPSENEVSYGCCYAERPGQSGNPRGRPKGARNKLGEEFLTQLCDHFEVHGAAAIERVCEEDPAAYLRIIVSVLPKELKIDRSPDAGPLSDLTDDELEALLYAVRNAVAQADAAAEQGSSEHSS